VAAGHSSAMSLHSHCTVRAPRRAAEEAANSWDLAKDDGDLAEFFFAGEMTNL